MKFNKKNSVIAIVAFAIFIMLAVICFMAFDGRIGFFKNSGGQGALPSITGKVTDNWKIYRNEEYGFEVKYPDYFTVEKYSKPSETAADVYCGALIADSLGVFTSEGSDSPSYTFSIYSNPWRLVPNDFFTCKNKAILGESFDDSKIEKIEIFNIGQRDKNTALVIEGSLTTVLASVNGNIYEIRQKAEKNAVAGRAELDLMLSTVKFLDIKIDPQVKKDTDFCADKAKNEFGNGFLAFSEPIKGGGKVNEDFFVGCAAPLDGDQREWLSSEPLALYHVIDNGAGGYDIAWSGSTGKDNGGLDWIHTVAPVSAGDLDKDGSDEIFFSGKGTCARNCQQWCLYLPGEKDLFCAVSYTRAQGFGEDADIVMEGRVCINDSSAASCQGECTVLTRTLCFDENASDSRYKVFKEYLAGNIAPGI